MVLNLSKSQPVLHPSLPGVSSARTEICSADHDVPMKAGQKDRKAKGHGKRKNPLTLGSSCLSCRQKGNFSDGDKASTAYRDNAGFSYRHLKLQC